MNNPGNDEAAPIFHAGEKTMQTRVGKREVIERMGRRMIRSYLPEQHRQFYTQLPFLVVGSVDDEGWPWASLLCGQPGFIHSPTKAAACCPANHFAVFIDRVISDDVCIIYIHNFERDKGILKAALLPLQKPLTAKEIIFLFHIYKAMQPRFVSGIFNRHFGADQAVGFLKTHRIHSANPEGF